MPKEDTKEEDERAGKLASRRRKEINRGMPGGFLWEQIFVVGNRASCSIEGFREPSTLLPAGSGRSCQTLSVVSVGNHSMLSNRLKSPENVLRFNCRRHCIARSIIRSLIDIALAGRSFMIQEMWLLIWFELFRSSYLTMIIRRDSSIYPALWWYTIYSLKYIRTTSSRMKRGNIQLPQPLLQPHAKHINNGTL